MLGTRITSSRKIVQYKTTVLYTGFFPVYNTMVLSAGGLMLRKNRYVAHRSTLYTGKYVLKQLKKCHLCMFLYRHFYLFQIQANCGFIYLTKFQSFLSQEREQITFLQEIKVYVRLEQCHVEIHTLYRRSTYIFRASLWGSVESA